MDHRSFVAGIDPDMRTTLTERTDKPALIRLALLIGIMALLGAIILARPPLWWVAVPVLGILTAFLFTLQHECTHKTPFRSPILSEWVGHISGFLIVQPFLWFRYFHLAHHKYTNDPERDPELTGDPKPQTLAAFVAHLSCIGYWRDKIVLLAQNARGDLIESYIPAQAKPRLRREARLMLAAYLGAAILIGLMPGLFWVWPGPLLFGFPVLRLYLLAEHGRCPTVANMFQNTRTTFTNRMVRLIAWNMPYHTEHHVFPAVPFHQLPALHDLTKAHLQQVEHGYGRFSAGYLRHISATSE